MTQSERGRVLAQLKMDVNRTKELYQLAKENENSTRALAEDLGFAHSDGKISPAIKLSRRCLEDYRAALFRYNRFLLEGTVPKENSGGESAPAMGAPH